MLSNKINLNKTKSLFYITDIFMNFFFKRRVLIDVLKNLFEGIVFSMQNFSIIMKVL